MISPFFFARSRSLSNASIHLRYFLVIDTFLWRFVRKGFGLVPGESRRLQARINTSWWYLIEPQTCRERSPPEAATFPDTPKSAICTVPSSARSILPAWKSKTKYTRSWISQIFVLLWVPIFELSFSNTGARKGPAWDDSFTVLSYLFFHILTFISLWIWPLEWKYSNPFRTSRSTVAIVVSSRTP